jgi:uncharacterized protein YutE (UPF0331/DUF86 family)
MSFDKDMINQKILDIDVYLEKLGDKLPETLEEFLDDLDAQLICQRIFEIITQTMLDICYHIIVKQKLKIPENYGDCIRSLSSLDILSSEEAERYRLIIGMRNIIVHQYGGIDLALLYHGLGSIAEDFRAFAGKVVKWISGS